MTASGGNASRAATPHFAATAIAGQHYDRSARSHRGGALPLGTARMQHSATFLTVVVAVVLFLRPAPLRNTWHCLPPWCQSKSQWLAACHCRGFALARGGWWKCRRGCRDGSFLELNAKAGKGKRDKGQSSKRTQHHKPHVALSAPVFPLEDVFSLDVECVAVGKSHEKRDRQPCSLALVNGFGQTVMRTHILPTKPVVSYLTPFTGLREGDLCGSEAIDLARAIKELKAALPKQAIIIGQSPEGDIEWMQLKAGIDFRSALDLAEVFANSRGIRFSLRHEALVLLGREAPPGVHDPLWDAIASLELYQMASQANSKELDKMRDRLTHKDCWPPKPSLARECGYKIDGVCLSGYNKEWCSCGRPLLTQQKNKIR